MMGYSVTEAASVLGVPTERVWELLARGVLSGEPEGESGMRVFLQPRPAPAPVLPVDEPPRPNGPERELSPFRELLTEFRSLTERYGQALLALGESRGEVASLRSRVDLLEARIDLRLPMGQPSVAPWPAQPLPAGEPSGPHPEAAVEHEDEDAHPRRRRGARRATESFAEALARAEDPSLAGLSRPADADALAAFRSEAEAAEAIEADRVLPREVLPAEAVLVADETEVPEPITAGAGLEEPSERTTDATDAAEPEVVDGWAEPVEDAVGAPEPDEDAILAALPAVDPEPWPEFESVTETAVAEEPAEAEPIAVEETGVVVEAAGETVEAEPIEAEPPAAVVAESETAAAPDEPAEAEAETGEPAEAGVAAKPAAVEVEAEAGTDEPAEAAPEPGPELEPEPGDFDAERYSSVIEEPDWFAAEADDSAPAVEEPAPPSDDAAADEVEAPEPEPVEPPEAEDEPGESGADEMEVAGGGQGASVQPQEVRAEGELPGARELDEALEAFGDLGGPPAATPAASEEEWPPASAVRIEERTAPPSQVSSGFAARPPTPAYGQATPHGPATRAYRRLRRIFPT
jgi:hypothetical protein